MKTINVIFIIMKKKINKNWDDTVLFQISIVVLMFSVAVMLIKLFPKLDKDIIGMIVELSPFIIMGLAFLCWMMKDKIETFFRDKVKKK